MKISKPNLSFWQIFNMNVGFLGIQYSFGLQQTAINPIFLFLGASEDMLPILNIAGPVTGLIVQPIIGAMSDKTWSLKWGRRKPYFLIVLYWAVSVYLCFHIVLCYGLLLVYFGFWMLVTTWLWNHIELL